MHREHFLWKGCLVHRQKEVTQRTGKIRIKLGMNPHISVGEKISFCSHIVSTEKKVTLSGFINDTKHKMEKEENFNTG